MKGTLKELANLLNVTNSKEYDTLLHYLTDVYQFEYNKIINDYVEYKKHIKKQSLPKIPKETPKEIKYYKDIYILQELPKDEIVKIENLLVKHNITYWDKTQLTKEAVKLIEFLKGICNLDLSMSKIKEILKMNQTLFNKLIKMFEKENIINIKKVKRYKKSDNYKIIINLYQNIRGNDE